MVAKQRVSMEGLEVWVEPEKCLRKFLDRIHFPFPYFHFTKPKWKLHVKRLPEPSQTNKLYWWLWLPDGRVTGADKEVNVPNLNPGEERVFEIGGRLISPTGDTALCMAPIEWMPLKQGKKIVTHKAPHHTLYEFRSIAEEELFIGVLTGIIVGIFLLLLELTRLRFANP